MAETTAQNVNNMASYADAAKQHTIFRDCNDQLSGVKPIFILESDVLGKPKADYGPDNGYKNEFLVPTEVYRAVGQHINVSNMIGLQRVRGLGGKTLTIKKIVNYYFHLLWCSETNQSTFTQEIPGMHSKKKLIQQRCV
jgi:hypothetical protein